MKPSGPVFDDSVGVDERERKAEVLRSELVQSHRQEFDEMGFINWDRVDNAIMTGPKWEKIAPILRLINDHRDEHPAGWL